MFFPPSYLFFFSTLCLGVFLSVSSSCWFGAWLGLELNLMSFIPLMSMKMNFHFSEASLKYFLIQALASSIIIFASSFILMFSNFSQYLLLLSLLIKMGAAPFHLWFPQIMENLIWPQAIILMTLQKVAPMFLISYLLISPTLLKLILVSSIFSAILGALGGLNSMSLTKIMAFSSINHLSWMLVAISINDSLWFMYFLFYSFISFSIIFFLHCFNIYSFLHLQSLKIYSSFFFMTIPLSLLSLGGLPPFTGFIPKWLMIQIMFNNELFFSIFFLLLSSLFTLYFYLRIMFSFTIMLMPTITFNKKTFFSIKHLLVLSVLAFFNFLMLWLPLPFVLFY
uniref:NADH dehydrogenase subunit 2 n=1 Tax=Domecia hispida TaxID=652862 RepID=UPI0028D10BC1|nr:NADH dehydrogenase subunit 2 [Domecia hispida]WMQ53168.1 NADH dehydrogenase subunit 2 [Domecia hispida]